MNLLATFLAAEEPAAPLILPPLVFGIIAAAVFITLAFVSWSFRDVANRHSDKTGGDSSHSAGH